MPRAPGPLVRLDLPRRERDRDDLDEIIDDLFPETDERPAWFDVGLVAFGAGLAGWALAASGPGWALVVGLAGLALGAILPVRWLWRRAGRLRSSRRRGALLAAGVAVRVDDPGPARLVRAYDELVAATGGAGAGPTAWTADPARLAAHGALLEVATLLAGRPVSSGAEREYVTARAAAIEDLVGAIRDRPAVEDPDAPDPGLVAEARVELDELTGGGALARLGELTTEARRGHDPD